MRIGSFEIGLHAAPFIVAELSANHNASLDRALAIVDAVAAAGAHAVKLQTYTADTITLDIRSGDFVIDDPTSLWHGRTLYDLYEEAHTPWEWHAPIFERARERGILCFSSPFDETAVTFLEQFEPPAYKIASFEITHLPLIAAAARTGRPLIISTGMATEFEIEQAVATASAEGATRIALLKCTSTYPASPIDSNLVTIAAMRERFGCEIGLSDHTLGIGVALAAVALGATIIEKHVTLARSDGGVDGAFSLEPAEVALLVTEGAKARQALGRVHYGPSDAERGSLRFRRSIYVVQDIAAGEAFTEHNLRIVRPSVGLEPKELRSTLGRRAKCAIPRGTPLSRELMD